MIQNIDIAPTVLELAGLTTPETMDGQSFIPLLMKKETKWRDAVFYEYYWEWNFPQTPTVHGIRTDRYKYIHYHGIWDRDELYDLQNDPDEMTNLIDNPEHQDLIWQPFFTTKGEYGTGLGLYICKRIIEGHHGRIFCQSEVGVGTTFTIQLPHETVREPGNRGTEAVDKAVA